MEAAGGKSERHAAAHRCFSMRCLRRLRENAVTLLRYALLSLLIGAGILGAYRLNPPAPLPDDAPPQEFSAYRALNHVAATAIAPHRTRTAANAKVRDYILDTLAGMGVQGEVISGTTVGMGGFGEPEDIIARLPGTNPTKEANPIKLKIHNLNRIIRLSRAIIALQTVEAKIDSGSYSAF